MPCRPRSASANTRQARASAATIGPISVPMRAQCGGAAGAQAARFATGRAERQTIDLFIPTGVARPPVLVFFHGGYWQELSKQKSAFAAPGCVAHGIAYAAVGYTLAPPATLSAIVASAAPPSRCLEPLRPLVVAGSSAGAHLAAMAALRRTRSERGGAGVRHLRPRAADRHLDQRRRSASILPRRRATARCASRSPAFRRAWSAGARTRPISSSGKAAPSRRRAARSGRPPQCTAFECAGRNHFDVILDLRRSRHAPERTLGPADASTLIQSGCGAAPRRRGSA